MASMILLQTFGVSACGTYLGEFTIKSEWNGFIELENCISKYKIIVRRKGWINSKVWAKEENAFIEQEIDILYADSIFNLPDTEVTFVKPEDN